MKKLFLLLGVLLVAAAPASVYAGTASVIGTTLTWSVDINGGNGGAANILLYDQSDNYVGYGGDVPSNSGSMSLGSFLPSSGNGEYTYMIATINCVIGSGTLADQVAFCSAPDDYALASCDWDGSGCNVPPPVPDYGPIINATYANTTLSDNFVQAAKAIAVTLAAVLGGLIALIGLAYGVRKLSRYVWHSDGTTNWLGSHWSWYDRHTYKPWKGYNRLHSPKWNAEHMM